MLLRPGKPIPQSDLRALIDFRVAARLIAANDPLNARAVARITEIESKLATMPQVAPQPGPRGRACVELRKVVGGFSKQPSPDHQTRLVGYDSQQNIEHPRVAVGYKENNDWIIRVGGEFHRRTAKTLCRATGLPLLLRLRD